MSEAHHLPANVRRKFEEIHPKDQTIKVNRRNRIEQNWGCEIQECLPLSIRPRTELKKGAKARIGDIGAAEEVWWNWSVELLRSLEELSSMTATNLEFAQELLQVEVANRQSNPKHSQRKIVELLLGDVQRVLDGMKRNQQVYAAPFEELGMGENDDTDGNHGNFGEGGENGQGVQASDGSDTATHGDSTMQSINESPSKAIPSRASNKGGSPAMHQAPRNRHTHDLHGKRRARTTLMEVKSTELRARAMRLRSQATNLEAAAIELEADAADLRSLMESS